MLHSFAAVAVGVLGQLAVGVGMGMVAALMDMGVDVLVRVLHAVMRMGVDVDVRMLAVLMEINVTFYHCSFSLFGFPLL